MTLEADPPPGSGHRGEVATVDDLLLARLIEAGLPKEAYELVLDALAGDSSEAVEAAPVPTSAYLTSIEVQGFRGIGESATLDLVPGPGLTIVTGRNGSGKSSFAEAAELALTGNNQRWANRTREWSDGWRNLHTTGERRIRVGLGLAGHRGGGTVECHWANDAELADRETFFQRSGERRRSLADLGWEQPMRLYRPFLSYAELGGLLNGKPSERYDSLHRVLGLDRLTQLEQHLKAVRRDSDQARKQAEERLPALRDLLASHPDVRAQRLAHLLSAPLTTIDLDQVDALAAAAAHQADADDDTAAVRAIDALTVPAAGDVAARVADLAAAQRKVTELTRTPAAQARALASLLQQALSHQREHPDQPCPVCGGRTLDVQWATETQAQVRRLTEQAEQLDQAHHARRHALAELRRLVPATPAALSNDVTELDLTSVRAAWRRWDDLLDGGDPERIAAEAVAVFGALTASLTLLQASARDVLDARQRAWQPVADQVRAWTETAREGRLAAQKHRAARAAVNWLYRVGQEIRNEQLAPVAAEAAQIWAMLRQDSNVDLGAIQLAGAGNRRRVDLDVAVDGEPGAALGVMSQGELHALALALFLPRAMLPASPFRFLVIDDPVQSMDPAKVYGLARVLERVAERRQVVVFTHDDRLPAAIRHLGIKAHLRVVSRHERSKVTVAVDTYGDPALRYLDDARAVAKDKAVDPNLRTKVVCVLVRDAIEARCHDVVLARGIRAGRPVVELEGELARAAKLRAALALALLDDVDRVSEVDGPLSRLDRQAPQLVREVNRGAHGGPVSGDLIALTKDAWRLIERMVAR